MSSPILIVGAGPTGLALAVTLAKQGVPFRIIEKSTKFHVGSRGTGIWPRTIEMHKFLGTYDGLQKVAGTLTPMQVFEKDDKKPTAEFYMSPPKENTPAKPYNNAFVLRQQFHEELLRNELTKFGVKVEFGVGLEAFEQSEQSVKGTILHVESGNTETFNVPYLVSAEGAHSIVRKSLGIGFAGETTTANFVIGDIEVIDGLPEDIWCLFGHAKSKLISLGPWEHPRSKWHSIICVGEDFDYARASESRESFVDYFHELFGREDVKFGELLQPLAHYVPNIRMVETCGKGRCFLAGDSAHVHPPTGGQGMNTGFQDAVNLGWKLGLVLRGLAPSELLDSYSNERISVMSAMLGKTGGLLGSTTKKHDLSGWDRTGDLDMLGINYRGTSLIIDDIHHELDIDPYHSSSTLKAGDRAPNAPGLIEIRDGNTETTQLFDIFGVTHHTALIFAKNLASSQITSVVQKLSILASDVLKTLVITQSDVPTKPQLANLRVLKDKDSHANKAYVEGDNEILIVIVRPDGYVGAMVKNADGIERYFSKLFI